MQLQLRPYVTAGVAIAGAGFIAVTPVGLPTQDIQTRVVQPTATFDDQDFPIVTATQLFDDTSANLQGLGQEVSDTPTPILDQLMTNWTGYLNDLTTGFETAGSNLLSEFQDLPTLLQNAFTDLTSGGDPSGLYDAVVNIWDYVLTAPSAVLQPVLDAVTTVAQQIAVNVGNVLSDQSWVQEILNAGMFPLNAAISAVAGVGQDIFTAVSSGDFTTGWNDLLNAPSTVVDAFLNGYQADPLVAGPESDALSAGDPDGSFTAGLFGGFDPEWGLLTNSITDGDSDPGGFTTGDVTVDLARVLSRGTFENLLQAREAIAGDVLPQREAAEFVAGAASSGSASGPTDPLSVVEGDPASTQSDMASFAALSAGVALPTVSTGLSDLHTLWDTVVADVTALFDPANASDISTLLSADLTDLGGQLLNLF